jgi:hypothetical protein
MQVQVDEERQRILLQERKQQGMIFTKIWRI